MTTNNSKRLETIYEVQNGKLIKFVKGGKWYRNALLRAGFVSSFLTILPISTGRIDLVYVVCSSAIFGLLFLMYGGQNKKWWD